ncbi:Late embryogenesis abundant protein, partial [Parasponia andersonii]
MADSSKSEPDSVHYTPLPPDQNCDVLPPYFPGRRRPLRAICTVGFALFFVAVYAFWPSDPDVKIVRMRLKSVHVHRVPHVAVDVSVFLTVRVQNTDVYSMDYSQLEVAVGYRGKRLGHVRSERGHVRARGSSYVDAELDLDGVEIFSDVVFLLEDLAKGTVPFDTVTEVKGQLGLFFLHFPLQ